MKVWKDLMPRSTNFSCRWQPNLKLSVPTCRAFSLPRWGRLKPCWARKLAMSDSTVKPSRSGMVETFCLHWVGFTFLACYLLLGLANSLSWVCNGCFQVGTMWVSFRLRVQIGLRWTFGFRSLICFCPRLVLLSPFFGGQFIRGRALLFGPLHGGKWTNGVLFGPCREDTLSVVGLTGGFGSCWCCFLAASVKPLFPALVEVYILLWRMVVRLRWEFATLMVFLTRPTSLGIRVLICGVCANHTWLSQVNALLIVCCVVMLLDLLTRFMVTLSFRELRFRTLVAGLGLVSFLNGLRIDCPMTGRSQSRPQVVCVLLPPICPAIGFRGASSMGHRLVRLMAMPCKPLTIWSIMLFNGFCSCLVAGMLGVTSTKIITGWKLLVPWGGLGSLTYKTCIVWPQGSHLLPLVGGKPAETFYLCRQS